MRGNRPLGGLRWLPHGRARRTHGLDSDVDGRRRLVEHAEVERRGRAAIADVLCQVAAREKGDHSARSGAKEGDLAGHREGRLPAEPVHVELMSGGEVGDTQRDDVDTEVHDDMSEMVPVRFDPETLDALRAAAEADDRSVSSWIRRAVKHELGQRAG